MSISSAGNMKGVVRTTSQLYRDCLRLANHISGNGSKKSRNIKSIVRAEFRRNAAIKDTLQIDLLKSNAIRGLSNYLMIESSSKDERFQKKSSEYTKQQVNSIQDEKKE
jgi:hypothetical protein